MIMSINSAQFKKRNQQHRLVENMLHASIQKICRVKIVNFVNQLTTWATFEKKHLHLYCQLLLST